MEPKTVSDGPYGPKIGAVVALRDQMRALHQEEDEKKTNIVTETTIEYSHASSLHGIQYIFESGKHLSASRIFWLALAIAAAILGVVWSVEAYIHWQENPTLNSLQTTGLPISDIDFPAITICGQGSIFEVTENVINWQFRKYVKSIGKDPDALTDFERQNLKSDMISDLYPGLGKSPKILVDTMLPNVSPKTAAGSSVMINGGYDPCQYGDCGNEVTTTTSTSTITTGTTTETTSTTPTTATPTTSLSTTTATTTTTSTNTTSTTSTATSTTTTTTTTTTTSSTSTTTTSTTTTTTSTSTTTTTTTTSTSCNFATAIPSDPTCSTYHYCNGATNETRSCPPSTPVWNEQSKQCDNFFNYGCNTAPNTQDTCLLETDIDYGGNDVYLNGGNGGSGHDPQSCRSRCKTFPGANYFSLSTAWGCSCKSSASGRTSQSGTVSGELWCSTPEPWRTGDLQCGLNFPTSAGTPGECNPATNWPCCAGNGDWCGNTADHCTCSGCTDYRINNDCCNTIEVTQGGSSAAYQAQPQIFTTYTLQSSTDGRVQYRSSSGYEYLQFGSEKNWEFQDYGGNKAYTPYSSWCPHDAGLTWYYWSGSTWVSAGDGIQVTCTSSSTEAAQSNQIDKMLNPEKISQYKLDVMKTESDIRA